MSIKVVAIPLLAASAAFFAIRLVADRRDFANHWWSIRLTPKARPERAVPVESKPSPGVVLPTAFWDSGVESERDGGSRGTFAYEPEDALDTQTLNMRWAVRATQSFEVPEYDDFDDPAEIAADSVSMISEASRSAASINPADREDDEADDDRV